MNLSSVLFFTNLFFLVKCVLNSDTLVLVHVLFRHGDRTPDGSYPKDPHINEAYKPYGIGQLTNDGKLREYNLGINIRAKYENFLGDYFHSKIAPLSSDMDRTKMSLELFLAGLFPPSSDLQWNKNLNWQPIPYNYIPFPDKVLLYPTCPNFPKFTKIMNSQPKVQEALKNNEDILNYLTWHTGKNVTSFLDIYTIYTSLLLQENYGLQLPEWTKRVFPEPLRTLSVKYYSFVENNDYLLSFTSGGLWEQIISNTEKKISNNSPQEDMKMFIYSGHDFNVASILISLNNFDNEISSPGSNVVIEVHEIEGEFFIKVYQQNKQEDEYKLLDIPNCGELCSFEKLKSLLNKLIVDTDAMCGIRS